MKGNTNGSWAWAATWLGLWWGVAILGPSSLGAQAVAEPHVAEAVIYRADRDVALLYAQPQNVLPLGLQAQVAQGRVFDALDVPPPSAWVDSLQALGLDVRWASRSLNAAWVQGSTAQLREASNWPSVRAVELLPAPRTANPKPATASNEMTQAAASLDYGQSRTSLEMLNLPWLHDRGFRGQGIRLAVFDSGFLNANTLAPLAHIFQSGRVLTRDFVSPTSDIFAQDRHGTQCLSQIASLAPGSMIGGADEATFYLARTEDVFVEARQEELNWAAATEWADSLGVRVISSSLIYNYGFTDGTPDYTVAQLDGRTGIITQAAVWAASRGILVVNSAGNEGTNPWRRISMPCDADSILCVGAVLASGISASFSGVGPTADGRTKPEVVAHGQGTPTLNSQGQPAPSNGTSFAAPWIASLAACLWQAYPTADAQAIRNAIRLSGHQAQQPDSLQGFGLPDARRADSILNVLLSRPDAPSAWQPGNAPQLVLGPNPATTTAQVHVLAGEFAPISLQVLDAQGRIVWAEPHAFAHLRYNLPVGQWPAGIYVVQMQIDHLTLRTRLWVH